MEELIIEMVAAQMPLSFKIEALKVQAIIARTFIVRKAKIFGGEGCYAYKDADLCKGESCKEWIEKEKLKEYWGMEFEKKWDALAKIVQDTGDKIITFNNKPIEPKFHAICGGATENSENVEDNRILYLRKVLCDHCKNAPEYKSYLELSLEEIEKRLNVGIEKPSPFKGSSMKGIIENIERDEEGRITHLEVGGKPFKGTEIVQLLGLHSTRFGWQPTGFKFEAQGKGHGMGLCQYGANTMAAEGKSAEEILKYYFTGVQIKEMEKPSIDKPLKGKIIVVDPGHGGDNTEDVIGPTGLREKDVNLSIALKLAAQLKKVGAEVYETRTEDIYVPLSKRAELGNIIRPHFFLSIHQNSFPNPNIAGSEIYHYRGDKEGEILANIILQELSSKLGVIQRGIKTADFYILREIRSSVLQIEIDFITNPQQEEKLKNEKFQELASQAIAGALIKYYCY